MFGSSGLARFGVLARLHPTLEPRQRSDSRTVRTTDPESHRHDPEVRPDVSRGSVANVCTPRGFRSARARILSRRITGACLRYRPARQAKRPPAATAAIATLLVRFLRHWAGIGPAQHGGNDQ